MERAFGLILIPVVFAYGINGLLTHKIILDKISLIILPVFFAIMILIIIKGFLWQYRGQEKVIMNSELLRIEKTGSILYFRKSYKIEKIDTFTQTKRKWFAINFFEEIRLSGGEIQFGYEGDFIRFGQNLKQTEAISIIKQLNQELKQRTAYSTWP